MGTRKSEDRKHIEEIALLATSENFVLEEIKTNQDPTNSELPI